MINLYIDVSPLVDPRPSGIGHLVASLVIATQKRIIRDGKEVKITLLVPRKNIERLDRWPELQTIPRKQFPFRVRILNGLIKYNLLPPMDLFMGKGTYLFGNFKNWPLTAASRSLTFIHDISFALYPDFAEPKNQKMLNTSIPKFIARTNRVLTISKASKNEINDYYHVAKSSIDIIYCGVDQHLYKSYSVSKVNDLKKQLGLKKQYFIFVGNIEPRKNLGVLIEAFNGLPQDILKDTSLLIIGSDGWQNESILGAINAAKKRGVSIVRPQKYVTDEEVATLVSGAEALVQPSIHEGFSMPPLEAIACGTLALASNIPVHREILKDAAIFFEPYSADDLKDKLEKVVTGKFAVKNHQKLLDHYSWDVSAQELLKSIESVPANKVSKEK